MTSGVEIDLFVLYMMSKPEFVSRKDKQGNHVLYLWPKALQRHAIFRILRIAWGRILKVYYSFCREKAE